jgi:hypothetical protein
MAPGTKILAIDLENDFILYTICNSTPLEGLLQPGRVTNAPSQFCLRPTLSVLLSAIK